jgi:uncharacterized membrane protein YbhN (UPF0104 family)
MTRTAGSRRGVWRTAISITVLLVALVLLFRNLGAEGLRDLGGSIGRADPWLLTLAAGVNLARYGLWALRWRWIALPAVGIPWWIAFRSLMVSVFLNTVVPAARPLGGIIRARLAARHARRPAGPYYGSTLVDQFGYSVVSALVGATCLLLAVVEISGGEAGRGPLPWVLGGLALVVAGFLIHPGMRGRLGAFMERRMPSARQTMAGAATASRIVLARPRTYVLMITGGCLVWLLNVVVLWIAGRAVGISFSGGAAAAAWAIGSLAGAISGTPGGAGTTEAAAANYLAGEGIRFTDALAAVFLARGLHYLSALLIGGACFITRPEVSGPLTESEPTD